MTQLHATGRGSIAGWLRLATLLMGLAPMVARTQTFLNLGTLPGYTWSAARGVNNSGQVVGLSSNASGNSHAFLYSGGSMTDLGTLPGGTRSVASAINDSGQVVGESDTSSGILHAFLYSGGKMIDLGTLPGGTESWGLASITAGRSWATPTPQIGLTTRSCIAAEA